ncbi:ATP-binding protein [Streptomyces sp. 7-21]|uniref:ATP-binding protein n=1 Tax=Streptomyces sp. 7-21 TaxID=2802283 RepID=UPI001F2BDAB1|nr:ATP-binding protein [Streptomyces sp. 7-21]
MDTPENETRAPGTPTRPVTDTQVFTLMSARSEVAPRVCRDFVAGVLRSLGHGGTAEAARVCTSELATNIVLHAAGESMLLRLVVRPGRTRIGIYDSATGIPEWRPSDDGSVAPHGRGLLLVDAMSARWDTAGEDPLGWYTKGVWFELPTDGTPSRAGNQA